MPELPEVETVRRGLETLLRPPLGIAGIEARRADLRWPLPDFSTCAGMRIQALRRIGKYLIFEGQRLSLLNHLGMTGSWRELSGPPELHDHVLLHLQDGRRLCYRDPRRFGMLDVVATASLQAHPRLRAMGPDPLDPAWTPAELATRLRGRKAPIKTLLMDQRIVAGIGNIYAVEACHLAGIRPRRAAGRLRRTQISALHAAIRQVLTAAIAAGGSSIRDFRQAGGAEGYFQHSFQVYDRAGQTCPRCGATLRDTPLAGRQTVWCAGCQD